MYGYIGVYTIYGFPGGVRSPPPGALLLRLPTLLRAALLPAAALCLGCCGLRLPCWCHLASAVPLLLSLPCEHVCVCLCTRVAKKTQHRISNAPSPRQGLRIRRHGPQKTFGFLHPGGKKKALAPRPVPPMFRGFTLGPAPAAASVQLAPLPP